MMQIRCQKCGWNFTLGHDVLDTIMAEIQDSNATHYMIDCPKCRRSIKVQTRVLKRSYHPPAAPEPADEGTE